MHFFLSYSHANAKAAKSFGRRLRRDIDTDRRLSGRVFDDRQLLPGQDWDAELRGALERSAGGILCLSADVLNSPYICNVELAHFLARPDKALVVVPLVHVNLRRCDLHGLKPHQIFGWTPDADTASYARLKGAEAKDEFSDAVVTHLSDELMRKGLI